MKIKELLNKNKNIIIVLFIIIIFRSVIIEPFRIPSESMEPTLLSGDFIIVNKFIYDIKIPFLNKTIFKINNPKRGDIVVFKHLDKTFYIKRVIGISGDIIKYENKKLFINNNMIKSKHLNFNFEINDKNIILKTDILKEYLTPSKEYNIKQYLNLKDDKHKLELTVPKNMYFVMGDNRDNSEDSRKWGFVDESKMIGKAMFIWFSIDMKSFMIRNERITKNIN
jgi:signal peptidase I